MKHHTLKWRHIQNGACSMAGDHVGRDKQRNGVLS